MQESPPSMHRPANLTALEPSGKLAPASTEPNAAAPDTTKRLTYAAAELTAKAIPAVRNEARC
jgi:hypothetical protein